MKNECSNESKEPILIINLDINRTIIFQDKGKGNSVEMSIKLSIAQEIWGRIDEKKNSWILTNDRISIERPDNDPDLLTYYDYLKKINKSKTKEEIPDDDERNKSNLKIKKEWEEKCDIFFNKEEPGYSLYPKLMEIINSQKISEKDLISIGNNSDFLKLYENNYRFIFPSLFNLMIELQKQGRLFTIIFRTFGQDFPELLLEFNSFCEGKHPLYKNIYFDGTHNSFDHRIIKETTGSFHRLLDDDINNIFLIVGEYDHPELNTPEELLNYYKQNKIIRGGKDIFKYIYEFSVGKKNNSFFISDDFNAWSKHDRQKQYGKPMFFDPDDKKYHFIFFDDNIANKKTSIVDCKNIINGKTLEYKEMIGKYLVKVDSIEAAINKNYFLEKIIESEKNWK